MSIKNTAIISNPDHLVNRIFSVPGVKYNYKITKYFYSTYLFYLNIYSVNPIFH